jgi:antitoxin (DNA-binding transcriptional repressor) of toxin-antitoxin stability system
MSRSVDIREAKEMLPELVALVADGAEVIITGDNQPLAKLVAASPRTKKRVAGLHNGAMTASDDFDEPLPDEFWTATE